MARFIGRVQGICGEATRLGSEKSGVVVSANGWNVGGQAQISAVGDEDFLTFRLTGGSNGNSSDVLVGCFTRRDLEALLSGKKAIRIIDLPQEGGTHE